MTDESKQANQKTSATKTLCKSIQLIDIGVANRIKSGKRKLWLLAMKKQIPLKPR